MVKENLYFRPFLVNVGVVVALSFAGFFYSRLITKKIKRFLPPLPKLLHTPDRLVEIDSKGNDRFVEIDSKGNDRFVEIDSKGNDRFVEIDSKGNDRFVEIDSKGNDRFVEIDSKGNDRFVEIDSKGNDRSKDILPTSEPEEMSMQRTSLDNASFDLSPRHKHGGDFLLQEFSDNVPELETETPPRLELDTSTTFSRSAEKDDYEQEIKYLRNMVRMLSERERSLEIQLFEYYGLKEQETSVLELQNQLKINKMEAKLFAHKIESLQAENQRLESQVADHARVIAELETARSKVKVFKKKLRHEAEQHRQQILNIQKRVARLQEQELMAPENNNQDSESRLKVLEVEAEELRKSNVRLQMENSQLSQKLQSTQIQPNSELQALNEMSKTLRQENQELTEQNEQLKAEKFTDVEELVYLRWINACLRHEIKNYEPLSSETVARDLSKSLSPRSEEKAKKLILEYAKAEGSSTVDKEGMVFDCDQLLQSASQTPITSYESSCENASSPASKPANKVKFFKKLRRLLCGKDTSKLGDNQQEDPGSPSSTKSCSLATSSDIPRWRRVHKEHVKDEYKHRRNSDFGSYGHKRLMSSDGKDDDLESLVETRKLYQDHDPSLKSDLNKFAELLKQQTLVEGKQEA